MGMIERGRAMMARVLGDNAQTVTYSRGASSVEISATETRPLAPVTAPYGAGAGVGLAQMDWLIAASVLNFGAGVVAPVRGDRITTGAGLIYEVGARSGETSVYRPMDSGGEMLRIFSQRIGA